MLLKSCLIILATCISGIFSEVNEKVLNGSEIINKFINVTSNDDKLRALNQPLIQTPKECSARSTGSATTIVNSMMQNLIASECALSSSSSWPEDFGPTATREALDYFDFIIVGAGAAGCVVANRLSENPNFQVLLIEAGGDPPIESAIPGLGFNVWNSSYTYKYFGEKTTKFSRAYRNQPFFPNGKMLGGSTSLNAMLYIRGVSDDFNETILHFNEWNVTGWKFDDVLKYFLKSEGNQKRSNGKYHNTTGPQNIDDYYNEEFIKQVILNGGAEIGYPTLNDINEDAQTGFVLVQGILKDGERFSSAKAYLSPIKTRKNLKVMKYSVATNLIINEKENLVEGVRFIRKGRVFRVKAKKEVILCAGAFETPKLLLLSGIGRAEDLSPFGIKQVANLPVGENLQDHVQSSINYSFLKSIATDDNPLDTFDAMYIYLRKKEGPFTGFGCTNALGFIDTQKLIDKSNRDIEILHLCFPKKYPGFRRDLETFGFSDFLIEQFLELNKETPILTSSVILLRPKSMGTVKLKSKNYRDNPAINLNYFADDEDMKTLIRGIREYRKILNTKSYKAVGVDDLRLSFSDCDALVFDSDDYWRCYISYYSSTLYHPVGTAKMSEENDASGVVGPNLKVKGLKGLRVIDASIIPNIIRGHTMAAVQMIAEKGSDMIKAEWT